MSWFVRRRTSDPLLSYRGKKSKRRNTFKYGKRFRLLVSKYRNRTIFGNTSFSILNTSYFASLMGRCRFTGRLIQHTSCAIIAKKLIVFVSFGGVQFAVASDTVTRTGTANVEHKQKPRPKQLSAVAEANPHVCQSFVMSSYSLSGQRREEREKFHQHAGAGKKINRNCRKQIKVSPKPNGLREQVLTSFFQRFTTLYTVRSLLLFVVFVRNRLSSIYIEQMKNWAVLW